MNDTREIFWNVGHGSIMLLYLFALVSVAALLQGFLHRMQIWRKGKYLDRFDHFALRFSSFVSDTLSQRKVSRINDGGLPHAMLFWSFLLLSAGTFMVMLQCDLLTPLFHVNLLIGRFYRVFSLMLDIAGLLAMLSLALLAARRFIIRPSGLESTQEDIWIHLLLFMILLTGFMIEGSRMAVTELPSLDTLAFWSPGGYLFARMIIQMDTGHISLLHRLLWWLHLLLGLGFIAIIPRTKLRHLVTTSGNALFEPHDPKGMLSPVNLDDEPEGRFGISEVADLSWKELFDTDACVQCGRCQNRCPAYRSGKPLSPMKLVAQIGGLASEESGNSLIDAVTRDAIWSCTTCGACEEICPAGVEQVNRIVGIRRSLVLMSGELPGDETQRVFESIEVNGNPFGFSGTKRGEWSKGVPVEFADGKKTADILYFAGCYASFDPRNQKVAKSFIRICSAAGLRAGILGSKERCCGEPVRRLGNEYLYRMMAESNIEAIHASGASSIVTACPHCFNTLSRDYRQLGLEKPVEHHSVFIERLIHEGSLKVTPKPLSLTFHDSCYLSRYRDITDSPRFVLKASGGCLTEMDLSRTESFCCGGGGGQMFIGETAGRPVAGERLSMALATGAPTLATACPFCLTMFEDGLRHSSPDGSGHAVRDLAEIVAASLERK
jgi:Fe-S oxidoreductase/nitrate reductase gamma subunit